MQELQAIIPLVGDVIGLIGVAVVVLGVFITVVRLLVYLVKGFQEEAAVSLRHSLMIYLSLGLDFLIAKDVIVTLSLENSGYEGIVQLGIFIVIRILLSYFVHLEEKALHKKGLLGKMMTKSSKKR